MGTGASQAESSGGSTGSAGAPVSRHAGAAGKGSGGLIGSERERNEKEKGRVKNRTLQKSKHAAPGNASGRVARWRAASTTLKSRRSSAARSCRRQSPRIGLDNWYGPCNVFLSKYAHPTAGLVIGIMHQDEMIQKLQSACTAQGGFFAGQCVIVLSEAMSAFPTNNLAPKTLSSCCRQR